MSDDLTTQGKIGDAYSDWRNSIFDVKGRTRRERYVPVAGPIIFLSVVISLILMQMGDLATSYSHFTMGMGTGLTMTLTIRRMRDAAVSWFMLPLAVIPVVNFGYAALLGALPSVGDLERTSDRR